MLYEVITIARQDARGPDDLVERTDHLREQAVHPLRERLHDEMLAVAIHHERGQQIRLRVHEAHGGRIDPQPVPVGDRALEA